MKRTVILSEAKDLTEKATKNVVISNEPSGEMRDLSGDAMCCNGKRWGNDEIPHSVLRTRSEWQRKTTTSAVILNEVKDLTEEATKRTVILSEPQAKWRISPRKQRKPMSSRMSR